MKKNFNKLSVISLLIISVSLLFLLTPQSSLYAENGISCAIRYLNQKIYHSGDSINIRVELYNNSSENFTFQKADKKGHNLTLSVKDICGREQTELYKFLRAPAIENVYFRNVTLQPGEMFAFDLDLEDMITLPEPGIYYIQADFYPGMIKEHSAAGIKSNILSLSLRPYENIEHLLEKETGEMIKRKPIAPDEAVKYTIEALQNNEPEKYFLYLDIEKLMLASSDSLEERYKRSSDKERELMIEEYKKELIELIYNDYRSLSGEMITYKPVSYKILTTTYTDKKAAVKAEEKFRDENILETKIYTYNLEKRDNMWIITGYEVYNKRSK